MKIPQIKFGEDFNKRTDAEKIDYLKKLASTMNNAADLMQKERNELLQQNIKLEKLLANAEKALEIQKQVTANQITSGNAQVQALSKQIQELQYRVRTQDAVIEEQNKKLNP